jgi:hypothetical protein
MAPREPIVIGQHAFPTKKAAEDHIRNIRDRYPDRVPLAGNDEEFMLELFSRHREWDQKRGRGIAHVSVFLTEFRNRAFLITRLDGSSTDISFKSCLKPRTHRETVLGAMRAAVKSQIWVFRDRSLLPGATCAITGQPLTPEDTVHVDHQPPFLDLVSRFLETSGLAFDAISVVPTRDNAVENQLADIGQLQAWSDFHQEHARLRLTHGSAHLRLPR